MPQFLLSFRAAENKALPKNFYGYMDIDVPCPLSITLLTVGQENKSYKLSINQSEYKLSFNSPV